MYIFGRRSIDRLVGVHPELILVIGETLQRSEDDLSILEGPRTFTRQQKLVDSGASQTLNSFHIPKMYGSVPLADAIDVGVLVDGQLRWDWPLYEKFGQLVKTVAKDLRIEITWGRDWKSLKDGPHVQRKNRI